MIWGILIAIVAVVVFNFIRQREGMLHSQVDLRGGMMAKYEVLVTLLTDDPTARVVKVTRDHIHIKSMSQTAETSFLITENFGTVDITWIANLGFMGTHNHKWSFPHHYDQELIVREMMTFLDWKSKQIFGQ